MAYLGEIGTENEARDDEFSFAGKTIRVNPNFSELDLIDFMEDAQKVDENDPKAITMVKTLFRGLVHADDFDTFWAACRSSHQTSTSMVKLYSTVVERMADRPSQPPSDSSSGRRRTGTSSLEDSYHEVLTQLDGRPDLQAVAASHYEASRQV